MTQATRQPENTFQPGEPVQPEVDSFSPTQLQVRMKARFWSSPTANMLGRDDVTLAAAQEEVRDPRLDNYWSQPGFKDWFSDNNSFSAEMLEVLYTIPSSLASILADPDANPAARVNAAKLVAELCNKMPSKTKEVRYADAQISKMSPEQLEEFVKKNTKLLGN